MLSNSNGQYSIFSINRAKLSLISTADPRANKKDGASEIDFALKGFFGSTSAQFFNCPICGFIVDSAYRKSATLNSKPVHSLETLFEFCPPQTHGIIFPLGWRGRNSFRAKKREQAKAMGYEIQSFVSKRAIVHSNVEIQENTLIYEWVIVQAGVVLGSNVTINRGANIGHHSSVGDNVFIADGVITGGFVNIGSNSVIGLGAILREDISIAPGCFIGMGQ